MDIEMLGLLAWIIPIFFTFSLSLLFFTTKNKGFKSRINELRQKLGKLLFDILLISHFLLWLVPFHGLLILVGLILPSQILDKKQRNSWSLNSKPRTFFIGMWLVLILICALIPISTPGNPNEWEDPIIIDDQRVSFWPASSQNVWLLDRNLDSPAVVTVLHQRIPGTFCPWLADYSTSLFVETLHIDESRLEETAIRLGLDPDDFRLKKIDSESKHTYKNSEGTVDISLMVSKRQIITDFPFENTVVGELITAYQVDWGGELWVITVTQIGNSNSNDPWAEEIILEWLEFRTNSN
ncbi:MAG: hypothetical protein CMA03_02545 [Euryarchaeota archaeon]|nr:hypothetical protein [Euryarchaeota archaeon]|tara:strand:+ start:1257 stop:2144 length:888 start_codon:yes stop_codon:yes gene_type:complete